MLAIFIKTIIAEKKTVDIRNKKAAVVGYSRS